MDNSTQRQPPPLPDERPAVLKFGSQIEIVCKLDAIMQSRGISQMALSQETGLSATVIRSYQRNSARRWDAGRSSTDRNLRSKGQYDLSVYCQINKAYAW